MAPAAVSTSTVLFHLASFVFLISCTSLDDAECAVGNGGCDPLVLCINGPGGFRCGGCPSGYEGSGSTKCIPVNECAANNGGCDPRSVCTDIAGGRSCGPCPAGFSGTGSTGCLDINGPAVNGFCVVVLFSIRPAVQCPYLQSVSATMAVAILELFARTRSAASLVALALRVLLPTAHAVSMSTVCSILVLWFSSCVAECLVNNGSCNALTSCANTIGSRTCGPCPPGYAGTGASGCTSIDECLYANGGCDALTTCYDTSGSRLCGPCPAGYTGSGASGCTDINGTARLVSCKFSDPNLLCQSV